MSVPQKRGEWLNLISSYLIYGGFPEIVVKGFDPKEYLSTLFDFILFKDVVRRYKVRHSSLISDLASYLVNNFLLHIEETAKSIIIRKRFNS